MMRVIGTNHLQFNVKEKASAENVYTGTYIDVQPNGAAFTYREMQQNGLQSPRVFLEKTGLGLRVPSEDFSVQDVKTCVGANRVIDVLDVATQSFSVMKMRDWCHYFTSVTSADPTGPDRVYCVHWLEFSNTKLEHYVESPTVVRQADWLERTWPLHLRSNVAYSGVGGSGDGTMSAQSTQSQLSGAQEGLAGIGSAAAEQQLVATYPKIRKFVHMCAAGSYLDWRPGPGGASQWLHVLRGSLVLWLLPPVDSVLKLYEKWLTSANRSRVFFPDMVQQSNPSQAVDCQRITLTAGNTLLLPSGWLYAIYWPEESIAFAGFFLHSFAVTQQFKIWQLEEAVAQQVNLGRYPFYVEAHWYVLARYVSCVLGADHLAPTTTGQNPLSQESVLATNVLDNYNIDPKSFHPQSRDQNDMSLAAAEAALDDQMELVAARNEGLIVDRLDPRWVHLTAMEWNGIVRIVAWLKSHPTAAGGKYRVPADLQHNAPALLAHLRLMLRLHSADTPNDSITGAPILKWPAGAEKSSRGQRGGGESGGRRAGGVIGNLNKLASVSCGASSSGGGNTPQLFMGDDQGPKRRRIRCRTCEPCRRDNCRECMFCCDMSKYGGSGTMKQCCIQKQCLGPVLPSSAYCDICLECSHATEQEKEADDYNMETDIYECGICWELSHPRCLRRRLLAEGLAQAQNVDGVVLTDLPNYWECIRCVLEGRQGASKVRVPKGLQVLRKLEQDAADGEGGSGVGVHGLPHSYGTRHASAAMMAGIDTASTASGGGPRKTTPASRPETAMSRAGYSRLGKDTPAAGQRRGGGAAATATGGLANMRAMPPEGMMLERVVDVVLSSSDEDEVDDENKDLEVSEYRRMLNAALELPFWSHEVLKGDEALRPPPASMSSRGRRGPLMMHRSQATRSAHTRQRLMQQCAMMSAAVNGAHGARMNPEELLWMCEQEGMMRPHNTATTSGRGGGTRGRGTGAPRGRPPGTGKKQLAAAAEAAERARAKKVGVVVTMHMAEEDDDTVTIRSRRRDVVKPKRLGD